MSRDFSTVVDDFTSDRPKTRAPGIHFDIKRFLNLRLLSVVVIAAVLSLPLAIAGWFAAPDVFTASAVLHFSSVDVNFLDQTNNNATVSYEKFVGTELAKLKHNIVLDRVLEMPEILKLPSIANQVDKLAYLMGTLSTSKSRDNELVTVYCTMKSRDEALLVLQKVMEVYETQTLTRISSADTYQIRILNEQKEARGIELDQQRTRIEELEGVLGSMDGGSTENSKEAEQYREEFLAAQERVRKTENAVSDVEELQQKIDAIKARHAADKSAPIYEFDIETSVVQDPRVSSSQAQLSAMESQVALLAQSHKPSHPALQAANRELESVATNVIKKEQLARTDALKTVEGQYVLQLEAAERALSDEKAGLESAQKRYDDYVESQAANRETASKERARIQQLKELSDTNRNFIAQLESRIRQIQLDERAPAKVSIASQPYASPIKDRKTKFLLAILGVMVAIGLGVAYGVARELLDRQIRTRQDIGRISDLPTIAAIPHLSEDRFLHDADSALLMAQHPNSTIADEFRRILARILFPEDNAAEIGSLLVVSASTEEGKTMVATNLAIALEQANRRVLLIDLSSQKPDIERKFGIEPGPGLSELLKGEYEREDLVRRTAFENLGVVGPGLDADALAGRLASREMMDFMEWADEHFDHIVVDTPPLLFMSDAKLLAPAMDGVLFVVGAGASSLGMVSRCLNDLEQLRANIIGIVINGMRGMRGGYMRKNQNLFYAYTEKAQEEVVTGSVPDINVLDEDVPDSVESEVVLLPYDDEK